MVQKLARLEATISDPTIQRLSAEASALELEYRMPSLGRDMPQDKVAALNTAKRAYAAGNTALGGQIGLFYQTGEFVNHDRGLACDYHVGCLRGRPSGAAGACRLIAPVRARLARSPPRPCASG